MKKAWTWVLTVALCVVFLTACGPGAAAFNTSGESADVTASAENTPTESADDLPSADSGLGGLISTPSPSAMPAPSAEGEEVALAYMDPNLDLFIVIDAADWTYSTEVYDGEVYFYPKHDDPRSCYTGIAISSQKKGSAIEQIWHDLQNNFKANIPEFTWSQEEDAVVGAYSGSRFHFSSNDFVGDYVLWETENLLFICSFTTYPNSYDEDLAILLGSLESFKVLSSIQTE